VETRTHFIWRQTGGSLADLNGTQIIVKFPLASVNLLGQVYTGIIPTVEPTGFTVGLLGANASISYPYEGNTGLLGPQNWIYPVANGGAHQLSVFMDATSPPGLGPNAYEPGAGAADPFFLYGTGRNVTVGLLVGGAVTFGLFGLLTTGIYEERRLRAWVRKRRLY